MSSRAIASVPREKKRCGSFFLELTARDSKGILYNKTPGRGSGVDAESR